MDHWAHSSFVLKELSRMGKKMDYGLLGMKMDRRKGKELTRMVKMKVYGLLV